MPRCYQIFVSCLFACFVGSSLAQGPLAPPGAPAPTMKTLDQIEPRRPISVLPANIAQPGSYYFTTNLTGTAGADGITISAGGVTIDLMGFELVGIAGSYSGIFVAGERQNILIHNGTIRNWGGGVLGGMGIEAELTHNSQFERLRIWGNSSNAISVGRANIIRDCNLRQNGGHGIQVAGDGRIRDCVATVNSGHGILSGSGSTITDCTTSSNGFAGISVTAFCRVVDNHSVGNGWIGGEAGILVTGDQNYIANNFITESVYGLRIPGRQNQIVDNIVLDNSIDNYLLNPTNNIQLIISDLPETISWPATVRFATSLIGGGGLVIESDNVSIDLNGCTIRGVPFGGYGIVAFDSYKNVTVRNGVVAGWGSGGVVLHLVDNVIVENVIAEGNMGPGIRTRDSAVIKACVARDNTEEGIRTRDNSVVTACTAADNGSTGISVGQNSVVTGSTAYDNEWNGISAGIASIIVDCVARANSSNGIYHAFVGRITGCSVYENLGDGIRVETGTVIERNSSISHFSGAGIRIMGDSNRIEDNNVAGNGIGMDVAGANNIILRNSARQNTVAYSIAAGNSVGGIVNVAGAGFTNANPWVNFEY